MRTVKLTEDYLGVLRDRAKVSRSRVSRRFQVLGLEVAQMLGDEAHKALYIKLAKEANGDALLALAKDVSSREFVKNRGAYFMRVAKEQGLLPQPKSRTKPRPPKVPKGKVKAVPRRKPAKHKASIKKERK